MHVANIDPAADTPTAAVYNLIGYQGVRYNPGSEYICSLHTPMTFGPTEPWVKLWNYLFVKGHSIILQLDGGPNLETEYEAIGLRSDASYVTGGSSTLSRPFDSAAANYQTDRVFAAMLAGYSVYIAECIAVCEGYGLDPAKHIYIEWWNEPGFVNITPNVAPTGANIGGQYNELASASPIINGATTVSLANWYDPNWNTGQNAVCIGSPGTSEAVILPFNNYSSGSITLTSAYAGATIPVTSPQSSPTGKTVNIRPNVQGVVIDGAGIMRHDKHFNDMSNAILPALKTQFPQIKVMTSTIFGNIYQDNFDYYGIDGDRDDLPDMLLTLAARRDPWFEACDVLNFHIYLQCFTADQGSTPGGVDAYSKCRSGLQGLVNQWISRVANVQTICRILFPTKTIAITETGASEPQICMLTQNVANYFQRGNDQTRGWLNAQIIAHLSSLPGLEAFSLFCETGVDASGINDMIYSNNNNNATQLLNWTLAYLPQKSTVNVQAGFANSGTAWTGAPTANTSAQAATGYPTPGA